MTASLKSLLPVDSSMLFLTMQWLGRVVKDTMLLTPLYVLEKNWFASGTIWALTNNTPNPQLDNPVN